MKVVYFCINNFLNIFIKLSLTLKNVQFIPVIPLRDSLYQINICVISLTFVYMIFGYHSVKYMYMYTDLSMQRGLGDLL